MELYHENKSLIVAENKISFMADSFSYVKSRKSSELSENAGHASKQPPY